MYAGLQASAATMQIIWEKAPEIARKFAVLRRMAGMQGPLTLSP
jgi:hypothetical protein